MDTEFKSTFGIFQLHRDNMEDKTLRAWDSSDKYALDTFKSEYSSYFSREDLKITLFNDSFGALTCAFANYSLESVLDSFSIMETIKKNLDLNVPGEDTIIFSSTVDRFKQTPDFIFLKIPGSNNYLEYLLQKISSTFPAGIPVIGSGMTRNIHSSTVELFEYYLSGVSTTLARQKSRLVLGETRGPVKSITDYPVRFKVPEYSMELVNNANGFSYGKMDRGTAYFLDHFPRFRDQPEKIIDLGCGDGSLAIHAAEKWPESKILCTDDSYLAVESAKENFRINGHDGRAEFMVTDCLKGIDSSDSDLILCNPPFHEYHSVSIGTAGRMFRDAYRVLKSGGSLFVVKNKHLGYQAYIRKIFGECRTIAGDRKYEILKAVKK